MCFAILALALVFSFTTPSVSQQVYVYNPTLTPVACGSTIAVLEVYVSVRSVAYGSAPQTDVAVYREGSLLWDERDEPGGFRFGQHEDDWYRQPLPSVGRYMFEVYVHDNKNVPHVHCEIQRV